MSLRRQDHNRKARRHLRPSFFARSPVSGALLDVRRRGLRLEPLEERRLLAVDLVTSNLDDGSAGTLRSVIAAAAPGDTIQFGSSIAQIDLTQGQIEIDKNLTIQGPASSTLTVDQTTSGARLFQVDASANLAISDLTLTGGRASGDGGGVNNAGSLSLEDVTLSNNSTQIVGGGIYNTGSVTISDSTLSGNSALSNGGGIFNQYPGSVTVANSTLSGNTAHDGGGIINNGKYVTLTGSTLSGNHASGDGGAVWHAGFGTTLIDCTLSDNSAANNGGGIYTYQYNGVDPTVRDSTISGNTAKQGGGIFDNGNAGSVVNSIVAGNSATTTDPDVVGSFTSDHDLIGQVGDATGFTDGTGAAINGNLVGTATSPLNPVLSVLGNYGGTTKTMVLLPGSPALSAGDAAPSSYSLPSTDQRGLSRLTSGAVDIGATQHQVDLVTKGGDDGAAGTLRAVIENALLGDFIEFALPGSTTQINLTQGEVEFGKSVTIKGPGAGSLTIKQTTSGGDRLFKVDTNDASNNPVNVLMSGLTLTGGNPGENAVGGAIDNDGSLALEAMVLSGNSAEGGAGIYNTGTLSVDATTFSNNSSEFGGGVYNYTGGTVTVTNSTFSENSAGFNGAGLHNLGTATVVNSTFSGNTGQYGGGLDDVAGTLTLTNSTVTNNSGSGLFAGSGTTNAVNSIIAGNSGGDVSGTLAVNDGNLIGTDPKLAPLGYYGGPTETMPPLATSPALNAGDAAPATAFSLPSTDQRGLPRLANGAIDIGATQHDDVVTSNTDDGGAGTLRTIITAAAPGDTISFASGLSQITLTQGQIEIARNLTIQGPGASALTVDQTTPGARLFKIDSTDTTGNTVTVSMSGFTITGGNGANNYGAGIQNQGNLTLNSMTVTGNTGSAGGLVNQGTAAITNSTFSNNQGGAIVNNSILTITGSTLSGNHGGAGGAIQNNGGTLTISASTLSGNTASGIGGAIFATEGGTTTISDSTLAGNSSSDSGGAIEDFGATIVLENSTISQNSATSGGGIYIGGSGTAKAANTIIAGNTGGDVSGTLALSDDNLIGTDAKLAPLGSYGGTTQTMIPLLGSPALNAGDPSPEAPFAVSGTDQRGLPRLNSGAIDIGATEHDEIVTTGADDGGPGTLRTLIAAAAPGDTITFQSGIGQINLTQGQIELNKNLTLQGPGASALTIDQTTTGARLFKIDRTDTTGNTITVSMSGFTITGGNGANNYGAGIQNQGNLTLSSMTVTGNTGSAGGLVNQGTAAITNSTFSNNQGGAIVNNSSLTITGSTVSGNHGGAGGAIQNNGGTLTISASTLSGNTASGIGGAIFATEGGTTTISDSTLAGNSSSGSGGAIEDFGATIVLQNSTISQNSATSGGGIYIGGSGNAKAANTIIAGNTGGDVSGTLAVNDGNLIGTDPKLAPLGNYGGPTETMPPLATSPALNAGDAAPAAAFSLPDTDQRGLPRLTNGAIDIGATQHNDLVSSNADDGGAGTLRTIITAAAPGDTITFASGLSQITLTQGVIEINKNLAIQGPGADQLTVAQNNPHFPAIFHVDAADADGNAVIVSISKMTLTQLEGSLSFDSSHQPTEASYPAIYNSGSLSLDHMSLAHNVWGSVLNFGPLDVTNSTFSQNEGAIQNSGDLTVSDSTFTGNFGSRGGAIANRYDFFNPTSKPTATVTRCIITNNSIGGSSSQGGGLYNDGTMTIVDSTISQNSSEASYGGGGIYNQGTMTIQNSTVSGNTADGAGGNGIYNYYGRLTVTDCTISDNSFASYTFSDDDGGGIKNDQGRLYVFNSTISGNTAKGNGGGIESDYGFFTVLNSTITGNTAAGTGGTGGGINNVESFGSVIDSTIVGNTASDKAGGVDGGDLDYVHQMFLSNTIVAGNVASGSDPDVSGDFTSSIGADSGPSDHDLIGILGDATGFTTSGARASLIGTATDPLDPKLGPLADNGGPTETMALLPASPAIDAGDNTPLSGFGTDIEVTTTPNDDQRGLPRIVNGTVDMGAFELSRVTASMNGTYTIKLVPGSAQDAAQTEILDPNNNVVFTSPIDLMPSLIFANTGGKTVNLTVDYSAGNPLPAGGLMFDGGGSDALTFTGYAVSTLTDTNNDAHSGTVQFGSGAAISYSGSSLVLMGTANDVIVNLPSGAVSATLEDDGTAGNNISQLVSTNGTFEATSFAEPTGLLTVNAGSGGDTITVARSFTTDFNANLNLNGGAGDDTFNVYATPVSGSIKIDGAGSIHGNALNDFTPSDAEIFSDAGTPPVISIASNGETPLTYASIQQVNITPGNGAVNVYGDNNQAGASQNDGYQVVGTGPNAFTLAISGNAANQAGYSQPINFSGVRTLNAYGEAKGATNAHSDANELDVTPYADNTPQGWGVQTFWNANGNGLLVYNGVNGVSQNISITPSGPHAGQLTSVNAATGTPVAVLNYLLSANVVVNGTDGSAGATDTLTLKGTNPGASGNQQFTADFATPGSNGSSVRISDQTNGNTLYTVNNLANFSSLNIVGVGASSQNTLLIDGYDPASGQSGQLDASLTVAAERSSGTAGVVSVFQAQAATTQYPEINYSGISALKINSAPGSAVQGPSISFGSAGVANSGLAGASDSGIAGQLSTLADRLTDNSTPTFYGTAQSGALVQLYVDLNGNGKIDSGDVFIGETTATPAAGGQANGQWTITSTVDLNNPNFGFAHDGLRTILATAQDGAGDASSPQSLTILLDTQGPQIGGVHVTGSPSYNLFLNEEPTPTPLVNSLNVTFTDPVIRNGGFSFPAVSPTLAITTANYQLVGRTNGVIPITSVTFNDNTAVGGSGSSVATLHFATPLVDDFYTLTVSDKILDNAGNALDGDFNGSTFPAGNGTPGGSFTGSFVVNSHPHLAVAANGSVSLDINGDGTFSPSNTVPDSDFIESFGLPNDQIFSGKFASSNNAAGGFDQLGAYGFSNNQWRWMLNLDPSQGTSHPTSFVEPITINGQPVAGYFAGNPSLGMQVGLFSNGTWWLDVLNHHTIDSADVAAGGRLKGNMTGTPIVGDFDGDGKTDLATYQNGVFEFDLSSKDAGGKLTGKYNATINAAALIPALASGAAAAPIAADLDGDGITDLGLYVTGGNTNAPGGGPHGSGFGGAQTTAGGTGQWFWLVSNDSQDAGGTSPVGAFASLNHAFNPAPLGHDLSYQYGDPSGTPLIGVWDPPTSAAGTSTTLPSSGFVSSLYATVLGRQASQADLTSLNNALAGGQTTNPQMAQMFVDSSERLASIINGYYEQYLGRAAEQAGLDYWAGVWRASGGSELVQAGIIGSPEYFATAGRLYPDLSPAAAWVTALYNNLLGRAPEADGLSYWVNYIQTHSLANVVMGFVTSDEYRSGMIDGWYEQFLGRPADSASAAYWLAQMEHGVTQDQIVAVLLSSAEFISRAQAGG